MARAWGVLWESWKGSQCAGGVMALRTGQVVRLAALIGRPGNSFTSSPTPIQTAASWARYGVRDKSSASSSEGGKEIRQGLLQKTFFEGSTRWWDNSHQESNSSWPDSRLKESGEGEWPINRCKSAWVDSRMDISASAASPCSLPMDHVDQLICPELEKRVTPESVKQLCQQGQIKEAVKVLDMLVEMKSGIGFQSKKKKKSGVDKYLFHCALKECVAKKDLMLGCQVHALAVKMGFGSDTFLCNHLIRMYAGHGKLQDAMDVFRGVVLPDAFMWSSIISAHVSEGQAERAVQLYQTMHATKVKPDGYVLVAALQACAAAGDLQSGKQVHDHVFTSGMEHDMFVCSCLVEMYKKCGSLKDARRVFDRLVKKDVVIWSAMISGYAQHEGMGQEALNMYSAMRNEGVAVPNAVTFVCLLEACANTGALRQGQQLHSEIREGGFESNVFVGTCLITMYAKCGRLAVAREVFDRLPVKDLMTWNALLKGYAENGEGGKAIECFEELLKQGILPNEVTYICLLTACSHAGLVDEGQRYFESMVERHGVEPNEQHYSCIVDLLGRSGHLDKAEQMLRAATVAVDAVSWTALLSACKSYGDAQLGSRCFDHLVKLEPTKASAYLLLGSIYASAGRWDVVERIENMRKAAGARKVPAKACIEVKEEVHEFTVGEERSDVAATLRKLNRRVKEGGHVPQTSLVLRAVSEQAKEDSLCGHAEKLALAYGLLHTPAGSTLVVTKNMKMCKDCHSSTKIMTRLEKRDIVVRDSHKVHSFRNGVCSCQDRP